MGDIRVQVGPGISVSIKALQKLIGSSPDAVQQLVAGGYTETFARNLVQSGLLDEATNEEGPVDLEHLTVKPTP